MCDVGGKFLNGIKSMYVNSLACIKVKGKEIEDIDKFKYLSDESYGLGIREGVK